MLFFIEKGHKIRNYYVLKGFGCSAGQRDGVGIVGFRLETFFKTVATEAFSSF